MGDVVDWQYLKMWLNGDMLGGLVGDCGWSYCGLGQRNESAVLAFGKRLFAMFEGEFFGFLLGVAAEGVAEVAVGRDGECFVGRESEEAAKLGLSAGLELRGRSDVWRSGQRQKGGSKREPPAFQEIVDHGRPDGYAGEREERV